MKTHHEASKNGDCLSCERCEIICKEEQKCFKDISEMKILVIHFISGAYIELGFSTMEKLEETRCTIENTRKYEHWNMFVRAQNMSINLQNIDFMEVKDA